VFENDSTSVSREGENVNGVMIGMIPYPIQVSNDNDEGISETESQGNRWILKVRMINRSS
jgi:hypothetical protein